MRPTALLATVLLAIGLVPAGCSSTTPMVDDVPPGTPQAIDGEWIDTRSNVRFQIDAGRMWADQEYTSGIWKVRKGQIEGVDIQRTGARRYQGWHPGYAGPHYLYLQDDDRIALLLRTALFGDYKTFLQRVSVRDAQAYATEAALAEPGLPWEDPAVTTAAAPTAPVPPAAAVAPASPSFPSPSASPPPLAPSAGQVADADFGRYHALLALEGYRRTLGDRDNLLIYYAGHGWLDEEADEGYWLPVDASPESSVNWIPNATLSSSLKAIRAKHVLVVADSCYSGKLTRGISVRADRPPDYLTRMARKRARVVLSSGGLEPVLDGGRGDHSVFAGAFLDALRENDGIADTTTLFSRIRRDVMLGSDQTPELSDIRKSGHEGGDFLFVPRDR